MGFLEAPVNACWQVALGTHVLMSHAVERDWVIDLPTSLSCHILGDWVSSVDLSRLDSAYCCHKKRGVVLGMFKSNEFLSKDYMPSYKIHRVSKEYWDWILRRDIRQFNVTVGSSGADQQNLASYAERHERYIGHLNLAAVESSSFALHCKHLVQLACNVTRCHAFQKVLQNNPNLCILDLHGLNEEHIESFKTICLPHLAQLRLDVWECTAELLTAILTMPARLLKLDLRNINTDLTGVAQHCPHLRSLSINTQNYGTTDRIDFDVAEFTSHLPRLVNLQLVGITDFDDAKLLAVVLNLKELRFLSLQFYTSDCDLTDASIEHIAEHCAATLEVFSLGISDSGTSITSDSLDRLRARCTKLRQFHIKAPFGYSDIPLNNVTTLIVFQCCGGRTLVDIANECPQLEVLQLLGGAADCTLPTLRELCHKCPKLRRVEIRWNSFALSYMKGLAATLPQLLVTDIIDDSSHDVMNMPI